MISVNARPKLPERAVFLLEKKQSEKEAGRNKKSRN
jgi:hypothetical protein